MPGPGHYGPDYETKEKLKQIEIATTGTVEKKFVTGLGVENRQKHSLFAQVIKQGEATAVVGPGSYEVSNEAGAATAGFGKKSFNTSLLKNKAQK